MKKILFAGVAAALLAGCNEKDEDNTITVLDATCERVAVASNGDKNFVVKCPITEKLAEIQARTPDSMFINGLDFYDLNAYAADAEHIYVEINPNASNGNQPIYRVMVQNPVIDGNAMYSVMAFEQQ